MSASPVLTRAFVSAKRRRPAPLSLEDDERDGPSSSGASSARSSPSTRSTPRRHRARPAASPAAGKPAWPLASSRSGPARNLRSTTAAAQLDKAADKCQWDDQSRAHEKDELGDDGQRGGSSGELGGGRRQGLQISVGDDDGTMARAHSSPPSLLHSRVSHSYRTAQRDSDEESPTNAFKRQRTACASPSHATTPPCSPIVAVSTHSFHLSYPVQPSPSPMLRQLTLDSDSPPALEEAGCVSSVHVTSSTMYFSRPLSLIIEEAEDIIVPVPYTPTPHPSPASPAMSPRRSREGRLLTLPYAGVTMRRGVRKTQQDAFVCRSEREPLQQRAATSDECAIPESFFAVFDGHGVEGGEVSTETSSWLPTYFFASLAAANEPSSPSSASSSVSSVETSGGSSAVSAAFETSFAMIDHLVCEEKGYRGGTTACCAYFTYQSQTTTSTATTTHSNHNSPVSFNSSPLSARSQTNHPASTGLTLHLASVGDSRALLFSAHRPARPLTVDHSTSNASEQSRIIAAGGHLLFSHCSLRVNGVLNVTRSVGDRALKEFVISRPEQSDVVLLEGDEVVMLVTDGVSNALSMDELQAAVTQLQDKPGELSDHIIDLALKRGSKDNVTAACIHIPTYLAHLRNATNPLTTTKQHPALLNTSDPATSTNVCTPPPSRERRDGALPPVPPFTCSPSPSSPSPSRSPSAGVAGESTLALCSVRSAERSSSGASGWRGSKAPLLTSRSRLSTSFFAMLPDNRESIGLDGVEKGEAAEEADISIVLSNAGVVLC